MGINERLKKLRKIKGINQEQAANKLGISLSSYQKYERDKGSVTPSLEDLSKLADFYGVSTDYLLGRNSEEQDKFEEIASEYDLSLLEKKILENYLKLPKDMRGNVMDFLEKAVKEVKKSSDS